MNLSFGEFGALVAKAFRGAGYSWGLTEEASFAAQRLAEFDAHAGKAVVRLLVATTNVEPKTLMPTKQWGAAGALLCPVCVGASILDVGHSPDPVLEGLMEPGLLAPFLATLSDDSAGYTISWDGGSWEADSDAITLTGHRPHSEVDVRLLKRPTGAPGETSRLSRVELDDATAQALQGLAHRTYAPATDESRVSGAGAGLLDAD